MRKLITMTLASSGERCLVNPNNIAFAMRVQGEDSEKESMTFSRLFLKELTIENDAKWVDVKETLDEIGKKCNSRWRKY